MTKKELQLRENQEALALWYEAAREYNKEKPFKNKQLRSCQAWVYETTNFYVLKSYNTFIAAIDKRSDVCVDVLRNVYCYTATSAKQINKFGCDYGRGVWGCAKRLTWRAVKRLSPDEEVERGLDLM